MQRRTRTILQLAFILALVVVSAAAQSRWRCLSRSFPARQRPRQRPDQPHDARREGFAVGEPGACDSDAYKFPAYDWWSEALHGVANAGTATVFPEPVGLAATFDAPLIHDMAVVIGTEARAKHHQAVRAGRRDIMEGLDFWSPNINIFRDPRWGRGQETYGEDPFLTARMGVAFITGMQGTTRNISGSSPRPKHFAVHSGPETTRHTVDVQVSKHDMEDTYLPAFRAAITEGKAESIMCAYNRINGQPACANEFLLKDELRGAWNFRGYVVSDCDAIVDVFKGHKFVKSQAEAAAVTMKMGMDNECADFFTVAHSDADYHPFIDAVKQGLMSEKDIDVSAEPTIHGAVPSRHVRSSGNGALCRHTRRRRSTAHRTGRWR